MFNQGRGRLNICIEVLEVGEMESGELTNISKRVTFMFLRNSHMSSFQYHEAIRLKMVLMHDKFQQSFAVLGLQPYISNNFT